MRCLFSIALICSVLLPFRVSSQDLSVDSLATYVVSATRTTASKDVVPSRVTVISSEEIVSMAVTNSDELLYAVPGLLVNRSWGIFSKNSAVTMRGLSGSARVLVLLDGVPLNRAGGGGINWHLVGPENLERVEVLSGPASALYGQNAMGGVIQLFSSQPSRDLAVRAGLKYGTFNTMTGNLSMGKSYDKSGFFWQARAFYREGDGYILTPEEERRGYETEAFLREGNFSLSGGVSLSPGHNLRFNALLQADKRGAGTKVFDADGAYNSYLTQLYSLSYEGLISDRTSVRANIYNQVENLFTLDEKVNNQGIYKLIDSDRNMNDRGAILHVIHSTGQHRLSAGFEVRSGRLDGEDIYRTSTDRLESGGIQQVGGLFFQDEITLLQERLFVVAGLRFDAATFSGGYLNIYEPTKETGFAVDLQERFTDNRWSALSPRLGVRYRFNRAAGLFISAGRGFSAPKLNDLTSSGKIRRGFKLANPELGPEVLNTVEMGANISPVKNFEVTPSIYYAFASSLQYQVSTGDSMDVAGEMRPVLQVRNVAGVNIKGAEIKAEYSFRNSVAIYGAYSYSVSLLNTADATDPLVSKLDGKDLSEVPQHLASAGLLFRKTKWFARVDWNFTGELWYDDENTILTESFQIFNLKAGYLIKPNLMATVTIQDLFDNVHIDKKGLLSPGRFITGGLRYQINRGG